MKFRALVIDPIGIGAAVGAGLLATLSLLPQARGELVYEEPDQGPVEIRTDGATRDPRGEDRKYLRQALSSSEKARATRAAEVNRAQPELVQPQLAQPAQPFAPQPGFPAQPVAAQPVTVGEAAIVSAPATVVASDPATTPVENLSKTELMRRERVREELKNEDAIQERLEQLRLRDERRRGGQILGTEAMLPGEQVPPAPGQSAGVAPMQGEVVVSPITDHPGQPAALPAGVNPAVANTAVAPAESTANVKDVADEEDSEKTEIYVHPYAGVANMKTNAAFEVKPHYSVGAGVGIVSSENISFELGYTYSDYGVALASSNPYVAQIQVYQAYSGYSNPETIGMKQNVFDAGVKISLLGRESRIRPFLGGGGGYAKSYVNYADGYTQALDQSGLKALTNDYDSSAFLGYLSTGFDVKVSKQLTLGGQFKYFGVLSSRENQQLNFSSFYTNPYFVGSLDADKRAVGASLSGSAFYTIQGTASFTF